MTKKLSIRKIYSVSFLVLMAVLGISSVLLYISNKLSVSAAGGAAGAGIAVSVSFSEQYPFEDNDGSVSSNGVTGLSLIKSFRNKVQKIADRTNYYLTTSNPLSLQINRLQSVLCRFNGNEIFYIGSSAIVKLSNGHLTECCDYCPSQKSYDYFLDFSSWLKDMDIPFVTLLTPYKSDDSITVFPEGIPHGYSQMLDEYTEFLDENELCYIDAKQILLSENDDLFSWFYRSDHHWNVRAAFITARETAKILNDELSIPTDTGILNDANFTSVVYPDSFLGGYGKAINDNALMEDMEILYPTTATDFHMEVPGYGIDNVGSFETTLIDQSLLSVPTSAYSAFLGGDRPLTRIENNTCDNGTRILVIKFSFADSLCPYLANTVRYLDMIDPRHFNGSIRSFIEQTEPDAVILCTGLITEYTEEYIQLK